MTGQDNGAVAGSRYNATVDLLERNLHGGRAERPYLHAGGRTWTYAEVAAAADAAGVVTTGGQDPWHPVALRGSAGLHFALPVARTEAVDAGGRPLVAVDPGGSPLRLEELPPRAMLAFGSERHGLSRGLLARADARVRIPMRSGVSSLNLATAVAAILFAGRLRAPL